MYNLSACCRDKVIKFFSSFWVMSARANILPVSTFSLSNTCPTLFWHASWHLSQHCAELRRWSIDAPWYHRRQHGALRTNSATLFSSSGLYSSPSTNWSFLPILHILKHFFFFLRYCTLFSDSLDSHRTAKLPWISTEAIGFFLRVMVSCRRLHSKSSNDCEAAQAQKKLQRWWHQPSTVAILL